jgi:hypothetical protein
MPNLRSLYDVLGDTCDMLHSIRKSISVNGHLDAMMEVDSLVAVTIAEAERSLRRLKLRM